MGVVVGVGAVGVVVGARGSNIQPFTMQPLCLKARRRDATAANIYAGKVTWYVLLYLYFVCVAMAVWDGAAAQQVISCYENKVKYEYSGARGDFECIPDEESSIWRLFVVSPEDMRLAISKLKISGRRMFRYKRGHQESSKMTMICLTSCLGVMRTSPPWPSPNPKSQSQV